MSVNAKSVMIQRSLNESYTTTGSPKLLASQLLPKLAWLMRALKLNAATRAPLLFCQMPTEVLIV